MPIYVVLSLLSHMNYIFRTISINKVANATIFASYTYAGILRA